MVKREPIDLRRQPFRGDEQAMTDEVQRRLMPRRKRARMMKLL